MNTLTIETPTAKFQPKEVKIGNYYLRFGNNGGKEKNKPTLQYGRYLTAGKNKGLRSQIWGYYYDNEQKRNDKAVETYTNVKANIESELKAKADKKALQSSFNVKDLVGKIFYSSWGYDQTNVDFYQVVRCTNKMVIIRKISDRSIEGSDGMMCDRVAPIENDFISEETKHSINVQPYGVIISNGRYPLSEYTQGERGAYRSWYA